MKLFGLILSLTLLVTTPTFKLNDNNDNGLNELFHYKMNNLNGYEEISKTTNVSISGTQHLITDENGNQNEAVKFNGDGGYKFNETPNLPSDYVIDINVKPYSSITDLALIISKADYKSNDNRDFTLGVGKEGSKYYIILNVFNDTLGTWSAISDYITIDTYHNVRVEFIGTFAQMFVDNKSLGTVDVKPRSNKVTPFIIGYGINSKNNTNTSYQAFKGEISDLKILEGKYDRDNMKTQIPDNPLIRYSFEKSSGVQILDSTPNIYHGQIYPELNKANATSSKIVTGIENNAYQLNGGNIIKTNYSLDMSKDFSISITFKVNELPTGTSTLIGQINTGYNQRELAISITEKQLLICEVRLGDTWSGARAVSYIEIGRWYNYTIVSSGDVIRNYINGFESTYRDVPNRTTKTGASLLIGGSLNGTNITQTLKCTVDEFVCYQRALSKDEVHQLISSSINIENRTNVNVINSDFYQKEVNYVKNVEFVSMQKSIYTEYKWQHGVSMTHFNNKFYATWGRNKGAENTVGEQAVIYESDDARNWKYHSEISAGNTMAYSHGVIYPHNNELYLMLPYYGGSDGVSPTGIRFRNLELHGFKLNSNGEWENICKVDGFWPLQQPIKMKNGNYIMAGIDTLWRSAVAISNGDDMSSWKIITIPYIGTGFTESNVIVEDDKISLYMRNENPYYNKRYVAGISYSYDFGESWTSAQESDLEFYSSKPCAGTLSDGTKYIIGNSLHGCETSRLALTIALSDGDKFSDQYLIRGSEVPDSLKETYKDRASLYYQATSYPSTFEKDGYLYVCYSSDMFGSNYNNIELAIIKLSNLYAYRNASTFINECEGKDSSEIIELFNNLNNDTVKQILIEKGFIALHMNVLNNRTLEEDKKYVQEVVETIMNIIDTTTSENIETNKQKVSDIFNSLTSRLKGLIELDDYNKIILYLK